MARNGIYEKLTSDPGDLVGILAYIAYKQHKLEFCQTTADGNPSREQVEQFQAVAAMETSLAHHGVQSRVAHSGRGRFGSTVCRHQQTERTADRPDARGQRVSATIVK